MKNAYIFICLLSVLIFSCTDEDTTYNFDEVAAPQDLQAAFDIDPEQSGMLMVTPYAQGASTFDVDFGDGSEVQFVEPGGVANHVYMEEGDYEVTITGTGITGLKSELKNTVSISFKAPENLSVNAEVDPINPFKVTVQPTADFATVYSVSFGESGEIDTTILDGQSVDYIYTDTGKYTITVEAKGASATTIQASQEIEILGATEPIELPVDFESATIDYKLTSFGPDGDFAKIVDNPNPNDLNGSNTVAEFTKVEGSQVWAGTVFTLGSPIDFSSTTVFTMDVHSPKEGIAVRFKIENAFDPNIFHEIDATTTTSGEWERLSFDFAEADFDQEYQKIAVFFDFGNEGDNSIYYFDNIMPFREINGGGELIEDFEDGSPGFTTFGNVGDVLVIANPDPSAPNTTDSVAQFTKTAGSEVWAGNFFEVSESLDLSSNPCVNFQLWSPKSGITVRLKIENEDASITYETDAINTIENGWEELTFDLSDAPMADYVRIVTFFEFGVAGDDAVYYFDEFKYCGSGEQRNLLEDFENGSPGFESFGNIDNLKLIANPDQAGINLTDSVVELTKNSGSEVWAGGFYELENPISPQDFTFIDVLTWSPKSGVVVKLKLENADASITHEVDVINSMENTWEMLRYDFTDAPEADYVRVVMFFDFGNAGDDSNYYFDEFYTLP